MDSGALLTIGTPIVVAIVTAIATIYIARVKSKQDLTSSITTGFRELTDQLQEERAQQQATSNAYRREVIEGRETIDRLERELRRARTSLELCEAALGRLGHPPPSGENS